MLEISDFAERELKIAKVDKDTEKILRKLCNTFRKQGHSGMSAALTRKIFVSKISNNDLDPINIGDDENDYYVKSVIKYVNELLEIYKQSMDKIKHPKQAVEMFNKLSNHEPITPLTFTDDEWVEFENGRFINARHSHVFKDGKNGKPYYTDAFYIFNKDKGTYSGYVPLEDGKYLSTTCYIKDKNNMPSIKIELDVEYFENGDWDFKPTTLDHPAIKELQKYYDITIKEG